MAKTETKVLEKRMQIVDRAQEKLLGAADALTESFRKLRMNGDYVPADLMEPMKQIGKRHAGKS
jgi:hypothetical protein